MRRAVFALLASCAALVAAATHASPGATATPREHNAVERAADRVREITRGMASWYGARFHGRRTASGEPFDMNAFTAAHPTLPFGTVVQVENPANGRSVQVRINDRGPFSGDRVIDLSRAAASALGLRQHGQRPVVVSLPPPPESAPRRVSPPAR